MAESSWSSRRMGRARKNACHCSYCVRRVLLLLSVYGPARQHQGLFEMFRWSLGDRLEDHRELRFRSSDTPCDGKRRLGIYVGQDHFRPFSRGNARLHRRVARNTPRKSLGQNYSEKRPSRCAGFEGGRPASIGRYQNFWRDRNNSSL